MGRDRSAPNQRARRASAALELIETSPFIATFNGVAVEPEVVNSPTDP